MGAEYFTTYGHGKDVHDAFRQASEEAAHWHGHGGYTGTIAEVGDFHLFTRVKGCRISPRALADAALDTETYDVWDKDLGRYVTPKPSPKERAARRKIERAFNTKAYDQTAVRFMKAVIGSKWEPCAAIEVTGKEATEYKAQRGLKGTHNKVFFFAGFASC